MSSCAWSPGVYWWCTECIDQYWSTFSNAYTHQALFNESGVALPAQKVWLEAQPAMDPCVAALSAVCPWTSSGESPPQCAHCVSAAARTLENGVCSSSAGLLQAWCLGVFGEAPFDNLKCVK
jgi:hypothetical protein